MRHVCLINLGSQHYSQDVPDSEKSQGDCWTGHSSQTPADRIRHVLQSCREPCRRSHVSRLETGAELFGAAWIPQRTAGIESLRCMRRAAAIQVHLWSSIHIDLFEPLQVLIVDGDDQSSSSLQQKLQELAYEGTPRPAFGRRWSMRAVIQ